MIRRITSRGGVIGCVPFNVMLMPDWKKVGRPVVPLRRFGEAIAHVAQVAGTHHAVAIGSDLDGGFGAEATPEGIDTIADLARVADVLADLRFNDEQVLDILGRNWIRFLRERLPAK
jgi:membrane dipeptidase